MWFFGPAALENFLDDHHYYRLAEALNRLKSPYNYWAVSPKFQLKNLQRCQNALNTAIQNLQLRERLMDKKEAWLKLSKNQKLTSGEFLKLRHLDLEIKILENEHWKNVSEVYRLAYDQPVYQVLLWSWRRKALRNDWEAHRKNQIVTQTSDSIKRCKAKGGCSSRQCGCCFRPRSSLRGAEHLHAHCTSECKCCVHYLDVCSNQDNNSL